MNKILAGLANKEGVGILIAKSSFGLVYANDFICETFGYTKDELLQLDITYIMDWKSQEDKIDKYFAVLNGDTHKTKMSIRFVRNNKSIFIAETNITNHGDNTVIELENITDTGETFSAIDNSALMKTAEKYDTNEAGILIISTKEGVSYANKVAYEAFGYSKNEILNLNQPNQFTHSNDLSKLTRKAITVYTGLSSKAEFPVRFLKKDGGVFSADLALSKHKEDGIKFLIMQFDNIEHLGDAAAAS